MRTLIPILLFLPLLASCATPTQMTLDTEVKRLCAIDGGIKVYETVSLPAERFDKYGGVNIPSRQEAKSNDEYFYQWDVQDIKPGKPENGEADLGRSHFKLYRAADRKLIGESIAYTRRGGDIPGPWHPSHFTCPTDSGLSELKNHVFVRNEIGGTK